MLIFLWCRDQDLCLYQFFMCFILVLLGLLVGTLTTLEEVMICSGLWHVRMNKLDAHFTVYTQSANLFTYDFPILQHSYFVTTCEIDYFLKSMNCLTCSHIRFQWLSDNFRVFLHNHKTMMHFCGSLFIGKNVY